MTGHVVDLNRFKSTGTYSGIEARVSWLNTTNQLNYHPIDASSHWAPLYRRLTARIERELGYWVGQSSPRTLTI